MKTIEKVWINITMASILPICLLVDGLPLPIIIMAVANTALCGIHLHLNQKREEARIDYLIERSKIIDPLPFLFEEEED